MSKKSVKHGDLRWDSANNYYEACHFTIKNTEYEFKAAKVFVRFLSIGSDVDIHVNGGTSYRDGSDIVIESNSSAVIETDYSIDQSDDGSVGLVVTIHSKRDGGTDTAYEFEYWTLGDAWQWYEMPVPIYYKYFDFNGTQ